MVPGRLGHSSATGVQVRSSQAQAAQAVPAQHHVSERTSTHYPTQLPEVQRERNNFDDVSNHIQDLREGIDPGDPLTKRGRIKKRKQGFEEDTDHDPDDPDRYRYRAYHIRRAFSLYGQLPSIINDGIKRRARTAAREDITGVQSDQDYETFLSIIHHLEGFENDIIELKNHPKVFRKLVRKIREAADQARNNDTANLKKDIACMLTEDGQSILKTVRKGMKASSKNDRGFENDIMGQYLCPVSLDWNEPREEIRDGRHAVVAGDWPRLLYANLECDLDDMEIGLGRNMALVRVVKYLFTGRSSAFSDTPGGKTTRSGNAALAGMTEITPKVVAYGACMLRFAISNEESWTKLDKEFNMEDFYWNVVGIFEESGDFGRDLLNWWNLQVFGTSQQTSTAQSDTDGAPCLSLLRSQRAAKRARVSDAADKENDNPRQLGGGIVSRASPVTGPTASEPNLTLNLPRLDHIPQARSSFSHLPGQYNTSSSRNVLPSVLEHGSMLPPPGLPTSSVSHSCTSMVPPPALMTSSVLPPLLSFDADRPQQQSSFSNNNSQSLQPSPALSRPQSHRTAVSRLPSPFASSDGLEGHLRLTEAVDTRHSTTIPPRLVPRTAVPSSTPNSGLASSSSTARCPPPVSSRSSAGGLDFFASIALQQRSPTA